MKRLVPTVLWVLFFIFLSGCLSQSAINEQLALCPEFVRDNVGPIKYEPLSPVSIMLISGVTNKRTGHVLLFALADENTVLHEAAHSVYFRANNTEQFYNDFCQLSRSELHNNLILLTVPMAGFMPCKDFRNLYASTNIYEDMAECFVAGMKGEKGSEIFNKKVDRVMQFYTEGR